ncbi:MAG: DNA repair protein RecN [Zoogloeaceae bacterium]|uniref:DNA repair protein RecN n=1 Tax=Denitromonas sp. TaxID=2734609 RepID=UPI001D5F4AC4|nr:DNA repair protein RecN [Rhodocyclaceae bacterium]MCP5220817.1 DNA repair protein RecN [Zoogloeaceae bacterium]HPR06231.1 DNA repair protein RecN [Denitromonas sp.]
MLRRLHIRDFVIVDELELHFAAGFGALTGETGAGKSILLDALGLVMGDRAESGVVRAGQSRAEMSAEFDLPVADDLTQWLDEQAIEVDDDILLLRRVVDQTGRSRAWINGVSVTLTQLREVGGWLADIHGQHAHHALLRADAQRILLDTYAGLGDQVKAVGVAWQQWQKARQACQRAEADAAGVAQERELLEWQVKELEALDFNVEAWRELEAEHARLGHATGLLEGVSAAVDALDEGEQPLVGELERLAARIAELAAIDPSLQEFQELLSSAAIQADEAVHGLRRYRDRVEADPERLADIEARIAAVTDMARKHRVSPEALADVLAERRARLDALLSEADPVALQEKAEAAQRAYATLATALSAARAPVAKALSEQVTAAMQTLAMTGGQFEIALQPTPEGSAHGNEAVEFQVAANPSQPVRPLAKVASGGELSRIGLAIQVITSRAAAVPTLIFDEVDVGIGGRVAEIVGRMLRELGVQRQVMCVTHLPQVAAQANWQWSIAKTQRDGETVSTVAVLDDAARIDEIARMLGGVNITDTTRQHATEILGLTSAA